MIRLSLERRQTRIPMLGALSPLLALAITLVIGAAMFAALGKPPLEALYVYFIEPLTEVWSVHELLVKAAPLILIAVGLAVCFSSNNWNIGAEGQFIMGAVAGSILPVLLPDLRGPFILPLMLLMGIAGGAAYAAITALLNAPFHTNENHTNLMLVYV
ncbi:MAG: ABC transporter permease, partial [Pseudomonadota bacterium]